MSPQTEMPPHRRLLLLVLPVLVWFAYFLLTYAVIAVGCAFSIRRELFGFGIVQWIAAVSTIVTFAIIAVIGIQAFRRWREAHNAMKWRETTAAPDIDRLRFFALGTLLLSLLSLIATVWVGLPILIVPPCA